MTVRGSRRWARWLMLAAAFGLLALGVASFTRRVEASLPHAGVEWGRTSAGPIALAVEPGGAAAEAGLREGDLLTHVNGRPVETHLDAEQSAWYAGEGQGPLRLRVRRGPDTLSVEVAPARRPRGEPYTYLAIVGLAFWASAVFLLLRWPWIFGGRIYAALALGFFALLTLSHTGRGDALDWAIYRGDLIAGALVPAFLLHVGVVLSRRATPWPRLWIVLGYVTAAGVLVATVWASPSALGGAYLWRDPARAIELRDRLELLWFALAWLGAIWVLARAFERASSSAQRGQRRWVLWGLAAGLGPFVTLYAVPWALGASALPVWAQFVSITPLIFVPAVFIAALARYRLHELDLIVLRGFAEVCSVFAAFAAYAGVTFLLREGVAELLPLSRSGARYVAIFAMAISYPQLRRWVKVGVERAFYRKRYSYRATLLDWARELNAETELPSLLERLTRRVIDTLGVPHAEVLLRREAGTAADDALRHALPRDLDPDVLASLEGGRALTFEEPTPPFAAWVRHLVPMRVKGELRAVLALAERELPEEPLTTEDRELIGTLAAHAATAIEAARLLTEVRRRAEQIESLLADQAKILESSAVGLLLLDEGHRIRAWNRALEEIWGLPRAEALGHTLGEVFPLHVVRRIEHERRSTARGEEARVFRLGIVNRRGERIVANLTISPAAGEAGGATVVTLDDVTERVHLEEQMLRQERLASLGLLAAGVAHEVNTPLTGISSYTQMLLEESAADDPHREVLEKIEAQTRRAARITNSLLDVARPERAERSELSVNDVVQETVQLFEPQVRGTGARLVVSPGADLPPVLGHRAKLQQVLINLLLNARDSLDGGGEIRIATAAWGGKVVIEVADDGSGIAEEDLPRIFDPFFSTKARTKGTGLGLSISYGIVREHGGEIVVDSTPGEGTSFRVELPPAREAGARAGAGGSGPGG